MSLLAVGASGDFLTMAFGSGSGKVATSRLKTRHADEKLWPVLRRLLARSGAELSDVSAVAAACGPGRFTGIRIGMTFAETLALALGRPALAVSEFEAWAASTDAASSPGVRRCVVLSAGRGDVCFQLFKAGRVRGWVPAGPPRWAARGEAEAAVVAACRGRKAVVVRYGTDEKPFDGFAAEFLLAAAAAKLASGKRGEFKPLYLRPAGYELLRGR